MIRAAADMSLLFHSKAVREKATVDGLSEPTSGDAKPTAGGAYESRRTAWTFVPEKP